VHKGHSGQVGEVKTKREGVMFQKVKVWDGYPPKDFKTPEGMKFCRSTEGAILFKSDKYGSLIRREGLLNEEWVPVVYPPSREYLPAQ